MPFHHYHARHHLTVNQPYTIGKNFGNPSNTSGNNLNSLPQPTNQHTPTQLQSAQLDFVAPAGALRRGFNRPLHPAGNTCGNDSGNDSGNTIGKTGNTARLPLHRAIPGHTSLSAIDTHHKKQNRGKNGNAPRMPHRRIIPTHNLSGNLTGKHSGKKSATLPATSAAHHHRSPRTSQKRIFDE